MARQEADSRPGASRDPGRALSAQRLHPRACPPSPVAPTDRWASSDHSGQAAWGRTGLPSTKPRVRMPPCPPPSLPRLWALQLRPELETPGAGGPPGSEGAWLGTGWGVLGCGPWPQTALAVHWPRAVALGRSRMVRQARLSHS